MVNVDRGSRSAAGGGDRGDHQPKVIAGLAFTSLALLIALLAVLSADRSGANGRLLMTGMSVEALKAKGGVVAPPPSATPTPTPSRSPSASPQPPKAEAGGGKGASDFRGPLDAAAQWARFEAQPCLETFEPLDPVTSCSDYDSASVLSIPWAYQANNYLLPFDSNVSLAAQHIVMDRGCGGTWKTTRHVCKPASELHPTWKLLHTFFPRAHTLVDGYTDGADYAASSPRSALPVCDASHEDIMWRRGELDEDTGFWKPADCRLPSGITRTKLKQCLRGKRLAVMGDSLMRQMFNRLISIIRGDPVSIDHYYHQHSFYRWDMAAEQDELRHLPFGCDEDMLRVANRSCRPSDVTDPRFKPGGSDPDALQLAFVWNPDLSDNPANFDGMKWAGVLVEYFAPMGGFRASEELLAWGGAQHLIASLNFWVSLNGDQEGESTRAVDTVRGLLQNLTALESATWVGYPCHPPPKGSTYFPHRTRDAITRDKMRVLRSNMKDAAYMPPAANGAHKHLHIIDACGLSQYMDERYRLGDGLHFQPIFEPRAPLPMRYYRGSGDYNQQDWYNYNLLRYFLKDVCPDLLHPTP